MSPFGRPDTEKKCCPKCRHGVAHLGKYPCDNPTCECHENPVQERICICGARSFSEHKKDCPTKHVQESVTSGAVSHDSSIHPDAGEWEKSFDNKFPHTIAMAYEEMEIDELKSFIRSQIELSEKREQEKALEFYLNEREKWMAKAKEIERSRISEGVKKMDGISEWGKAAFLKVLHEV